MVVITIIDAGPARRLIPWCSALIHIRGKPATNPLAGIYRNRSVLVMTRLQAYIRIRCTALSVGGSWGKRQRSALRCCLYGWLLPTTVSGINNVSMVAAPSMMHCLCFDLLRSKSIKQPTKPLLWPRASCGRLS